jgi:pyruvate formate-lyase/glycerol dehydratase family glycyl radical enzyme
VGLPAEKQNGNGLISVSALSEPSARIRRIRADLLATPNSICLERPTLLAEFAKTPAGKRIKKEHPFVRRAGAIAYILSNRTPHIYRDELIIGNMSSKRIGGNYYPEGGSLNILLDMLWLKKKQSPISLSKRETIRMALIGAKTFATSVGGRALLKPARIKHFFDFFFAKRYFITEEAGIAHQVAGYGTIVNDGLKKADSIAAQCLESGKAPNGELLNPDQRAFYESVRTVISGIRKMAENLADEAERFASEPGISPTRRAELIESAKACRHVPYEPARTFAEGLQACWLIHVALNMEDFEQGMSFGRLDQILRPLYNADIESGRLTTKTATELLASFELKTCETIPLYSEHIDQFFSGNGVAQGITVGGMDAQGNDVTNELSGLILDAYAQIRTREPALHVRVHGGSPDWLIEKAAQVIQLGAGKPSLFGDEAIVEALTATGMTIEHARDYGVIGCVELGSQGRTYNSSDAALFNLPICLELALNEGRRLSGGRLGASTPPVSTMESFDEIVGAFRAQVEDSVAELTKVIGWLEDSYRVWRPTAINSILTEGCIERGGDVTWGNALYDYTSIQVAGLADTGDSLYAIKRLVFDEKRMTLPELVAILKTNYAGHEKLRTELDRRFPRYGNAEPEVDAMTQLAADVYSETIMARKNSRGGKWIPGIYSMTCHVAFGKITGALPNGRNAGKRLSNGLSPADGTDRKGPTSLLNSAASLDSRNWANCYALNLKFDKAGTQGEKGARVLSNLLRGFFNQGGMQVQINVLDAEMLRAAQADPNAHLGLVVRVAGYCAYFSDLSRDVQNEIIARTAHGQ